MGEIRAGARNGVAPTLHTTRRAWLDAVPEPSPGPDRTSQSTMRAAVLERQREPLAVTTLPDPSRVRANCC